MRIVIAAAAALFASAAPATGQSLGLPAFMLGQWVECATNMTTRGTWIAGTDVMVGAGLAHGSGPTRWEHMRIEMVEGRATFFGSPMGAAPVAFPAVEQTPSRIVFENAAHDFPQRIVYERRGGRLVAQAGSLDEAHPQGMWVFRRADDARSCAGR